MGDVNPAMKRCRRCGHEFNIFQYGFGRFYIGEATADRTVYEQQWLCRPCQIELMKFLDEKKQCASCYWFEANDDTKIDGMCRFSPQSKYTRCNNTCEEWSNE